MRGTLKIGSILALIYGRGERKGIEEWLALEKGGDIGL
jgi:hypothetical protein